MQLLVWLNKCYSVKSAILFLISSPLLSRLFHLRTASWVDLESARPGLQLVQAVRSVLPNVREFLAHRSVHFPAL